MKPPNEISPAFAAAIYGTLTHVAVCCSHLCHGDDDAKAREACDKIEAATARVRGNRPKEAMFGRADARLIAAAVLKDCLAELEAA